MRKSDRIVFGFLNLVYLLVSCLVAKLAADLVLKLADSFVVVSFHDGALISVISVAVFSLALVAVLAFADGYRYASFDAVGSLIAAGGAALIHFVIGLISRFAPLLCGPTRHLSGLISQGGFYNSIEKVERIPFGVLAVVGLVMMLVYAAVMTLGNFIGCRKRLRDRAETMGTTEASI